MEEQCELYNLTDLLPALEAAGLADPLMFLGCSPPNRVDGMRGVATSMSHDDALRYAASKLLKSGVGGLPRLRHSWSLACVLLLVIWRGTRAS